MKKIDRNMFSKELINSLVQAFEWYGYTTGDAHAIVHEVLSGKTIPAKNVMSAITINDNTAKILVATRRDNGKWGQLVDTTVKIATQQQLNWN